MAEDDLIHYVTLLTQNDPTGSKVWNFGQSFNATGTYVIAAGSKLK
jgi:hypothetical protein